ncbi:MAG: ATP-binding protein [candidate division NC10 bacterium]
MTGQGGARLAVGEHEESLEILYRLMADNLLEFATILTDPRGRILSFTAGAERMTGWRAAEVVGRSLDCLGAPEGEGACPLASCLESAGLEGRHERECRLLRRDAEAFWVHLTLLRLCDAAGRLRGFAALAQDVTERRRLSAAEQGQRALTEALQETAQSLTDTLELDEILDRILSGVARVVPNDASTILLLREKEGKILHSRGTVDPRAIRSHVGAPIRLRNRVIGFLSLDATSPDAYTESAATALATFAGQAAIAIQNADLYGEIRRYAGELERRVAERTRDLEAARQEAEAASHAKSDFLANMSHELRTPLNAVLGFSQLLLGETSGALSDRQRRYLGHVRDGGDHLLQLLQAILDVVALEDGTLTLECRPLSVASAVTEALETIRARAGEKRQSLEADVSPDLPPVMADPVRFGQVLRGLLDNAVKFTPPGGSVRVAARRISNFQFPISNLKSGDSEPQSQIVPRQARDGSAEVAVSPEPVEGQIANPKSQIPPLATCHTPPRDFVEIAVADTGIGIASVDLPKIFQTFTQLESAYTKQYAGIGLGLVFAKRLVELHGGTMEAASPGPGQGSTFTVRLPIGEVPAPDSPLVRDEGRGARDA